MSKSNADVLLEAMQDMHNMEQICTRETLAKATGLAMSVVDDRMTYLCDRGMAYRVQRGVYVPSNEHKPARIITRSLLPDGTTVLEVGDCVLHLSPRESRMVGELMAGAGHQYAAIALGHQAERIAGDLARQVRSVAKSKGRRSTGSAEEK